MRLAVVGSRTFQDMEYMFGILDKLNPKYIASGGAIGADSLAIHFAKDRGIAYEEFLPLREHGYPAGLFIRNRKIVDATERTLAFWDGESRGTGHTLKYSLNKKKPTIAIVNRKIYCGHDLINLLK